MNINLKGELAIMDSMNLKPNYAALGRKYGMDYRTVKKYHNGYEGRPKTRNKKSKLDYYRTEIVDKLKIKLMTTSVLCPYPNQQNAYEIPFFVTWFLFYSKGTLHSYYHDAFIFLFLTLCFPSKIKLFCPIKHIHIKFVPESDSFV